MTTFVLIHGAGHGAWCWHKIVPRLQAAGHRAVAPDMPGHGADRSPTAAATLQAYTERTCQILDDLDEPVVLVGHSMGGLIISQAAEQRPDKITKLIYLCAFMLTNGQTLADKGREFPESLDPPPFEPNSETGEGLVNPQHWRHIFYADCSAEDQALARACLVPQCLQPFVTPMALSDANYGRVPRIYIECHKDEAVPLPLQRSMQQDVPCEQVLALDSSHSPFFSQPDQLSTLLVAQA